MRPTLFVVTRAMLAAAVVAPAVGCSESSGPLLRQFTVTFSATVDSTVWRDRQLRQQCWYTMTARATGGDEGDLALWQAGEVEYRWDDGSSLIYPISEWTMRGYWRTDGIRTGQTLTASHSASSLAPFRLGYSFRYLDPTGDTAGKSVTVDCR